MQYASLLQYYENSPLLFKINSTAFALRELAHAIASVLKAQERLEFSFYLQKWFGIFAFHNILGSRFVDDVTGKAVISSSSCTRRAAESDFRCERQWFPWWQITLPEVMSIEGFSIEGWQCDERHPPLFTILLSDDGEHWLPIWTQPLHEPVTTKLFSAHFSRVYAARHIRIRMDGFSEFGFDRVQFITSPAAPPVQSVHDILSMCQNQASDSRVVFSTLFNESDAFLKQYIDNFLAYTAENVCLALNFPSDRQIPSYLTRISPRVHIFNGQVKREKWGHTLLVGHIESFEAARAVFPDFRYFATMASNGLMVRPFDLTAAILQLPLAARVPVACERAYELDQEVDPIEPTYHGTWMWHHLRNSEGFGNYLKTAMHLDRVSVTQIEGLFARREDWDLLQEKRAAITGLEKFFSFENFMAIEELLPTSVFNSVGSGEYTHICRVLWSGTRQATVDDLLEMVPHLPDHLCSVKWFDRSPVAQSTLAVTTDWGRALLTKAQNQEMTLNKFQETTLASKLVDRMHQAERFGPLTDRWWKKEQQGQCGFRWSMREVSCERQRIDLDIPAFRGNAASPAYLYMEATGQRVSCAISIYETDQGETALRLSCSAISEDGGPVSGVHLQGYLYLSGLQGSTVFRMTMRKDRCVPPDILSRTVFFDEYGYTVDYADRLERDHDMERHYFVREARRSDGQVWIGLPVFCNAIAEVTLAVGPNFKSSRNDLV
ncbi:MULTISPECIES: discoidin domain-containing protein [Asaia]|nr:MULTISPECIES: discoidin domain-containing protein [Asaia]